MRARLSVVAVAMGITLGARADTSGQSPITGPAGTITTSPPACRQLIRPEQLQRRMRGAAAYDYFQADPWPNGIVPIEFAKEPTDEQMASIVDACATWAAGTGVMCVLRDTQARYVLVEEGDEEDLCAANIGSQRDDTPTTLTLGTKCWSAPVVRHEFGHVLGLIHEHQRSDRDSYVSVDMSAVQEGEQDQFTRIASSQDHTPYDFGSLMHYTSGEFAKSPGLRVLTPLPQYGSVRLGGDTTSILDLRFATATYGVGFLLGGSGRPGRAEVFAFSTSEAVSAMQGIDHFYRAPYGLARENGLSIGGRPDFLGLAAWFFDVYMATRYAGYDEADARYNVAAFITQSEEWHQKHPGATAATPLTSISRLPFSRDELFAVMLRLDRFYAAPEGLQRPNGLSLGGRPDFLGIAAWVVDVYLGARLQGAGAEAAWSRVEQAIRASDEWRAKH